MQQGPGRRPTEPAAERRGAFGHGHVVGAGTSRNAVSIVTSGAGTWCMGMWRAKTSIYPTCRTPSPRNSPSWTAPNRWRPGPGWSDKPGAPERTTWPQSTCGSRTPGQQSQPHSQRGSASAAQPQLLFAVAGADGPWPVVIGAPQPQPHPTVVAAAWSSRVVVVIIVSFRWCYLRGRAGARSGVRQGPPTGRGSRTRRPAPPAAAAPALTCGSSGAHSQPVALWPVVRSSSRRS